MEPISLRIPNYLKQRVDEFAESRGMLFSEAVRFILSEYTMQTGTTAEVAQLLKRLTKNIESIDTAAGKNGVMEAVLEEFERIRNDSNRIKQALILIGQGNPRTKIPIEELFPEYS